MKKVLSLVMASVFALGVFAGCGGTETPAPETPTPTPGVETPEPTPEEPESGIVKMGLGIVTSLEKSGDLTEDGARAQVDTVMVVAGFDADGRVVSVTIDNAQSRVQFDAELALVTDITVPGKSKVELGDDYGMKRVSGIEKEWYEQIAAFEEWMIGKTPSEINGLKVKVVDDAHQNVPDVEELTSSVTITVESYIAGLMKAYMNAVAVEAGTVEVGLGHVIDFSKSKAMEGETMAMAQVDTTIAAVALDAAGTITGVFIDVAQTRVNYDAEGLVTNDRSMPVQSKAELKENYGMKRVSGIEKEWYEQAAALEDYMIGKTLAEVQSMPLEEGRPAEDLASSVTITVGGYLAALEKAVANAR